MKKIQNTRILYRYLLSYFSVILLSCAVIGIFLFNAATKELNHVARQEIQKKIFLIAADMENQKTIMSDIALNVATTIYYKPYYRERGKYFEIELLEDFAKYDGQSQLADDYFLFYRDDPWVFKKNAKNTFKVYFKTELGMDDSTALYDRLNEIDEFTIILPENPQSDWLLFAYPVPITGISHRVEYAYLCFITHIRTLEKRAVDVAGLVKGSITIRHNGQYITSLFSSEAFHSGEGTPITAQSPEGQFALEIGATGNAYANLDYFLWINLAIVLVFVLLFLGLSAFFAYSNYRPIKELAVRYNISDKNNKDRDEIRYIDFMLKDILDKQRVSQNYLRKQFSQLKRQQLLLLLNGGYGSDVDNSEEELELFLPGSYYGTLVIQCGKTPDGGMEALCKLVEDLSDNGITFYAVELKKENCFAVLAGFCEESKMDVAIELISTVMEASGIVYTLGVGSIYNDIHRIPASLLAALSSCEASGRECRDSAVSLLTVAKWYDDRLIVWMIASIRSGQLDDAKKHLNTFIRHIEDDIPSLIIRRCIFSDVLNIVIRMSLEMKMPISQELISPLLIMDDYEAYREAMLAIITDLCHRVKGESEHYSDRILKKIISYIEANSQYNDLSQKNIADHFNMSENHLYRIIKEGTGKTYKDYVQEIRIKRAKTLLKEENLSVAETCQRVGYINISHFIKTFKRLTGYTPAGFKDVEKAEV